MRANFGKKFRRRIGEKEKGNEEVNEYTRQKIIHKKTNKIRNREEKLT